MKARRTDPATSHAAASSSTRFAGTHKSRIMAALAEGPCTTKMVAHFSGLTVVQVDRRANELVTEGRVKYLQNERGKDMTMNGYRVWVAV